MKRAIYPIVFALLVLSSSFLVKEEQQPAVKNLFVILEKGKWGYIDKTGKTVIPAQFYNALDFSEGLAPVRKGGMYGYIDEKGQYALPEQYDYAEPFLNGTARVYIDGKPYIIDRTGKKLFEHNFTSFGDFHACTYSAATTATGKVCLINNQGKMLTDSIFHSMQVVNDGKSVVTSLDGQLGVIDTLGNMLVPFGKYDDIGYFSEGYAIAEKRPPNENQSIQKFCINAKGEVVYTIDFNKWYPDYSNPYYHEGYMQASVVKNKTTTRWEDKTCTGYVDYGGNIVFSDTNWQEGTPFSHKRAFVQDHDSKEWTLIDTQGDKVTNETYEQVWGTSWNYDVFENGWALVFYNREWIFIDVNGKQVAEVTNEPYNQSAVTRIGNTVLYGEPAQRIFIPGDTALTKTAFEEIAYSTVHDDLIQVATPNSTSDGWAYINRKGKVVWQLAEQPKPQHLNIDFMNRGYYYAASEGRNDLNGAGGWAGSKNGFRAISTLKTKYTRGNFQVIIDTTKNRSWFEKIPGHAVYMVNDTKDTLFFSAQDSRIEMVLQARDKWGQWKDIEYLPNSWCGNSYHTLHLPVNNYWEFTMPVYEGIFKTKIRARVNYRNAPRGDELTCYSNEVSGSINPAQFWRKREYFPQGLMDPYND